MTKKKAGSPKPKKVGKTVDKASEFIADKVIVGNAGFNDPLKNKLRTLLASKPEIKNVLEYPREWGEKLYPELQRFMAELERLAE